MAAHPLQSMYGNGCATFPGTCCSTRSRHGPGGGQALARASCPLCGGELGRHLPLLSTGTAGAAWRNPSWEEGRRDTLAKLGTLRHPAPILEPQELPQHRVCEEPGCAVRGGYLQPARSLRGLPGPAKSLQLTKVPGSRTRAPHKNSGKERRPARCQGWGELPAGQGCLQAPASAPGGGTPPSGQAAGKHRPRPHQHPTAGGSEHCFTSFWGLSKHPPRAGG